MSFILHEHLINDCYVFMIIYDYVIGNLIYLSSDGRVVEMPVTAVGVYRLCCGVYDN